MPSALAAKYSWGHHTQWAAQFAVASELCKRGYEVSLTMGHSTPLADLMVISPKRKKMFLVDVKGSGKKSAWIVKRKEDRENLYYVLAYVPTGQSNEFYVMTQREVNDAIQDRLKSRGRRDDYPVTGVTWKAAAHFKDAWRTLPP